MAGPVYSGITSLGLGSYRTAIYPSAVAFASQFGETNGFFCNASNANANPRAVGKLPSATLDFSASGGILLCSLSHQGGSLDTTIPAQIFLVLYSGSNSSPANRKEILLNRAVNSGSVATSTLRPILRQTGSGGEFAISMDSALPVNIGTFVPSDIRLVEYVVVSTAAQNVNVLLNNLFWIPTLRAVDGEVGNPSTLNGLRTYIVNQYGNGFASIVKVHAAFQTNRSIQIFPCSIQIGNGSTPTYHVDTKFNLFLQTGLTSTEYTTGRFTDIQVPNGNLIFRIQPSSTCFINLEGSISCDAGFRFFVDAFSGTPTINLELAIYDAINTIILRPGVVFTGSLNRCGEFQANGATCRNVIIAETVGASGYLFEGGGTIQRVTISSCTIGARVAAAANYSTRDVTIENSATADVLIDAGVTGAIDISGVTFPLTSTSSVNIRYLGTGTVTVSVSRSGLTTATPNGGTVVLVFPVPSIRLFNLPTVANTVLRVKNLTTNVVTNPTPSSGEVTIAVDAAADYEIRADAPGYLMQQVTLSGATPEFAFSLRDFRALYDSGTNISTQVSFSYSTLVVTVNDDNATISFADMFRTIEDYLATASGLEFDSPPYPVILPDRNLLWFPITPASAVNPVRVKPDPTNTTDPALLFETYLEGATDPAYGLFDFSAAGGRIIRIRTVVAIAQVQGDGSFTSTDRSRLTALNATLASSGVFSTGALANAPSGGGSFDPATDPVIVGSIQANAITANAIANSAITDAKIASNAITAAKIATDAITADKLAADVATEIQGTIPDQIAAVKTDVINTQGMID